MSLIKAINKSKNKFYGKHNNFASIISFNSEKIFNNLLQELTGCKAFFLYNKYMNSYSGLKIEIDKNQKEDYILK